jgi:nucleoside-diphosphate-sugar epimerase
MRVFIAGAGGAIGRRLVPRLVERGHDVTASTRSADRHEALRSLGAAPVTMDGLDAGSVAKAIAHAAPEVVVHQMTALAGGMDMRHFDRSYARTNRLRTEGTDHLLAAAAASGARRMVAQSFTGWPNARGPRAPQTEADPLDPSPPHNQRETMAAIRRLERAVLEGAPLEGVILRYGAFYGPGTSMDEEFATLIRARKLPVVGGGRGVWSFVHIDDAAAATVAAVEGSATGIFDIVDDDPAPVAEWLPYLAARLGARPPRRIPSWLARPLIGDVGISMMTRISGSSNTRARRELGFEPRYPSWRDGFRRAA